MRFEQDGLYVDSDGSLVSSMDATDSPPPVPTTSTAVAEIAPPAKHPRSRIGVSSKRPWDRQVVDWPDWRAKNHGLASAWLCQLDGRSRNSRKVGEFVNLDGRVWMSRNTAGLP